jgi:hypothetical protein
MLDEVTKSRDGDVPSGNEGEFQNRIWVVMLIATTGD